MIWYSNANSVPRESGFGHSTVVHGKHVRSIFVGIASYYLNASAMASKTRRTRFGTGPR